MSSRRNKRGTRCPRCIVTSPSRSSLLVLSVLVPVCRIVQALPIHKSRPDLSLRCRAVVEAVLLCGGSIGTAGEVAPHLGLHNRFELGRLLKHEGLPALHYLAAWANGSIISSPGTQSESLGTNTRRTLTSASGR